MEKKTEEKDIKEMNLYEKLSKITDELGVVGKNLEVGMGNGKSYKAVSERDILDKVKPLEIKYRIYSYPFDRKIIDNDTLVRKNNFKDFKTGEITTTETNSLYMRVETIYRFVNVDKPEEFIDIKSYGDGIDTGDKATGKAMTYADKYALMKSYKISTGDDPDQDGSPENGYDKEINYRDELVAYCSSNGINMSDIAKEYKLNTKSSNNDFKKALDGIKGIK